MKTKSFSCLLAVFFLTLSIFGQNKDDEKVNNAYIKFAESYSKLDADAAANSYTSGASLTYLYENTPPSSIVGRESIRKSFSDLFQNVSRGIFQNDYRLDE